MSGGEIERRYGSQDVSWPLLRPDRFVETEDGQLVPVYLPERVDQAMVAKYGHAQAWPDARADTHDGRRSVDRQEPGGRFQIEPPRNASRVSRDQYDQREQEDAHEPPTGENETKSTRNRKLVKALTKTAVVGVATLGLTFATYAGGRQVIGDQLPFKEAVAEDFTPENIMKGPGALWDIASTVVRTVR